MTAVTRRPHRSAAIPRLAHALVLCVLLASAACRKAPRESRWTEKTLAGLTLRDRVSQLVLMRVAQPADTLARARVVEQRVGGILLAGGRAADARSMVDSLGRRAALPMLVAMEMDRGAGAVLDGATEFPEANVLAAVRGQALARSASESAGREARGVGVSLAIVTAPLPIPDPVRFGFDLRTPAAYDGALGGMVGLRAAGLLVAGRAFPPPDDTVPGFRVFPGDRAQLAAGPLDFVRRAAAAQADGIVLGPIAAPALTGDTVPLAISPVAVQGAVRRDQAYGGLVLADLGAGSRIAQAYGEREAAVRAVVAGADLLVGVDDVRGVVEGLLDAVRSGRIPPARIDEAVRRIFRAKEKAGLGRSPDAEGRDSAAARVAAGTPATRAAARAAFDSSTLVYGGTPGQMLQGCARPVLVTAPGVRAEALAAGLRIPGGIPQLQADSVRARGPLTRDTAFARNDADCVVIAHFGAITPGVIPPPPPPPPPAAPKQPAPAKRATGRRTTPARRPAPAPAPRPAPVDTATRRRIVDVAFLAPALPEYAASAQVLVRGTGADAQASAAWALAGGAGVDVRRPPASVWPPARVLRAGPAASAGMDATRLARVDDIIRQGISDGVFPGAALAIGRHGVLVRMQGYGRLHGEAGAPAAADTTLYDLASLTKVTATTAAAMALVDEGKLSLDAPVRRYLPDFRGGDRGDVTIRNLLTHTAGLPPGEDLYNDVSSPEAAMREVIAEKLVYTPGTKMVYSDFSMILLKAVVEKQAGEPMDRYLAHRVWAPLGMSSTMYMPSMLARGRTAPGAIRTERPYVVRGVVHDGNAFRLGGVAGHAGLFSTARDLAVYVQTLMNGGAYGPRRVYSRGVVARFTADQGLPGHRGLGWDRPAPKSSAGALFSARSWGHTGFTGTVIWADPDKDLFVVLLTNRTYDHGNETQIYEVRRKVAEAAALAITDMKIVPRPGAILPPELRPKPTPKARPAVRGRGRSTARGRATTQTRRPAPRTTRRPTRRP
ncbi:MAG TPA: serine hydrolase [Longimicrobiaceae bacterium]|nr:serine hydrolase [Longimicrobiaceae bacterium]